MSQTGLSAFLHTATLWLRYAYLPRPPHPSNQACSPGPRSLTPPSIYFPNLSWVWPPLSASTPAPYLEPTSVSTLLHSYRPPRGVKVRLDWDSQIPAYGFYGLPHRPSHMLGRATSLINSSINHAVKALAPNLLFKHTYCHDIPNKESVSLSRYQLQIK